LCSSAFADDFLSARFNENPYYAGFGQPTYSSNGMFYSSPATALEQRNLAIDYSGSNFDNNFSAFRETENQPKANTYTAVMMLMADYKSLHGIKRIVEETDTKLDYYTKKFKLKGSVALKEEASSSRAKDGNMGLDGRSNIQKDGSIKSRIFNLKFMPSQISWDLGLDFNDEAISGQLNLGNYFAVEGNVGDTTDVFLMFRYNF
jgi:hypothetical protein